MCKKELTSDDSTMEEQQSREDITISEKYNICEISALAKRKLRRRNKRSYKDLDYTEDIDIDTQKNVLDKENSDDQPSRIRRKYRKKSRPPKENPVQRERNIQTRIAPRSCLQYKIGPGFEFINNYCKVISKKTEKEITFNICPRIDRGFELLDNQWIGYKRNYFTLVSSFHSSHESHKDFLLDNYEINFNNEKLRVKYFVLLLKAKGGDNETEINLVQHTAKRDKGPQFKPQPIPIVTADLPDHKTIRESSNVRNNKKVKIFDSAFYLYRENLKGPLTTKKENIRNDSVVNTYPSNCIKKVARFERVQFSSSISVKKPKRTENFFKLHVILGAIFEPQIYTKEYEEYIISNPFSELVTMDNDKKEFCAYLQEVRTPPLIIRGRSPSNYINSHTQQTRAESNSTTNSNSNNENNPEEPRIITSANHKEMLAMTTYPPNSRGNMKLSNVKSIFDANKKDLYIPSPIRDITNRPSKRNGRVIELKNPYRSNHKWNDRLDVADELINITNKKKRKKKKLLQENKLKERKSLCDAVIQEEEKKKISINHGIRRVQTTEQIEQELWSQKHDIKTIAAPENTEEIDENHLVSTLSVRTSSPSSYSINMKDIELKPTYKEVPESVLVIGSLAFKKIDSLFNPSELQNSYCSELSSYTFEKISSNHESTCSSVESSFSLSNISITPLNKPQFSKYLYNRSDDNENIISKNGYNQSILSESLSRIVNSRNSHSSMANAKGEDCLYQITPFQAYETNDYLYYKHGIHETCRISPSKLISAGNLAADDSYDYF